MKIYCDPSLKLVQRTGRILPCKTKTVDYFENVQCLDVFLFLNSGHTVLYNCFLSCDRDFCRDDDMNKTGNG